jgi:3-deoxy-D-manno-octulosonic acid kinase
MKNMDLNCPTPVAAMLKKRGLYYQADIISKKISCAKDLHHILLKVLFGSKLLHGIHTTKSS